MVLNIQVHSLLILIIFTETEKIDSNIKDLFEYYLTVNFICTWTARSLV